MGSSQSDFRYEGLKLNTEFKTSPETSDPFPGFTLAQKRILAGQVRHPDSPLYNMAFLLTIAGAVSIDECQARARRILGRNDALRTALSPIPGGFERTMLDPEGFEISEVDFCASADPKQAARAWADQRATVVFQPGGWLVEIALLLIGDGATGLYVNQHHLLTDGWSTPLLFDALLGKGDPESTYYTETARSSGIEPGTPPEQHPLHFYGEKPNESTPSSKRLRLPVADAFRGLKAMTPFQSFTDDMSAFVCYATLTAAWLYRTTGRTELRIDCPIHRRDSAAAKKVIGLFMEMRPLPVAVDADDSFSDLGVKVQAAMRDLLSTEGPAGLSSAVLNFVPFSLASPRVTDIEWLHPDASDPEHQVRLQIHDFSGSVGPRVLLDLNVASFKEEDGQRAVSHLASLQDAMAMDPTRKIAAVDLLTGAERELIASLFQTRTPEPIRSVIDRFLARVEQQPDAPAVVCRGTTLTFAELHQEALRVAAAIQIQVEPGQRVGLFYERQPECVATVLGALFAGTAFVPLDPSRPDFRIQAKLRGAEVALVLGPRRLLQERRWNLPTMAHEDLPAPAETLRSPDLEDEAYVLFTSGSTGIPKAIPISHEGLADYLAWAEREYDEGRAVDFPWFTSLSFDLTLTSFFLPLMTGGTLRIYPAENRELDASVLDVFTEDLVDVVKLTPSHLALVRDRGQTVSRISRLIVGGEDLKASLARAVLTRVGGHLEIINEYGPTETVVGCMIHRFDPDRDLGRSVPIGRPADGVKLYVVNEARQPVPPGVPGELYVYRRGMASGYLNRKELNPQHFMTDVFASGDRVYRTGDLVRMLPSGDLVYLGRKDRQVKVRGFRLELGELETALAKHPGVRDCVMTASSRTGGKARAHQTCRTCGIAGNVPRVEMEDGLCSICRNYETYSERAAAYFKTPEDLRVRLDAAREKSKSEWDCMVFLSGGKDSTYALCKIVELGYRVYAFTLDNGYLSVEAKENIRKVAESLGVAHEFGTTPAMNRIFRDSLQTFSNVCQGCFKTVYTLGIKRAYELGIPAVVTGLSRGQFFETRLAEALFQGDLFDPDAIDRAILEARKVYHRQPDEVRRSLDTDCFQDDHLFDAVEILDFYRYWDVALDELYAYLEERIAWTRPSDTGRSTNCLINELGIFVHQKEQGFHNYALPYSWDVRMGHKTREQAVRELDDDLDEEAIRRMLRDVGYEPSDDEEIRLAAYYTGDPDLSQADLRDHVRQHMSGPVLPDCFVHLEQMPLTPNGKINYQTLPDPEPWIGREARAFRAPETEVEIRIAEIWQVALKRSRIPVNQPFFELGGHSLLAMEAMFQTGAAFDMNLPLEWIFSSPTVEALAEKIESALLDELEALDEEEAERLANGSPAV